MQTFLPYPSFADSAACLDRQRLGKQRVEAKQIWIALNNPDYGWQNHPATKMWRGYDDALAAYGLAICIEWRDRGYKDTLFEFFYPKLAISDGPTMPWWLGDWRFHRSHQAVLQCKYPEHYKPLFKLRNPCRVKYVWPVKE